MKSLKYFAGGCEVYWTVRLPFGLQFAAISANVTTPLLATSIVELSKVPMKPSQLEPTTVADVIVKLSETALCP
jgi:hypothetical protein